MEPVDKPPARPAGHAASVAFAAVSVVLVIFFLTGSTLVEEAAMLLSSAVALVAVGAGLRIHRVLDQRPWLLVAVGLALLTVVNAISWVGGALHEDGTAWLMAPFQLAGYLALLAASGLIMWHRAPNESGSIIDAAVVGIAAAAPVWEFALLPALAATGATPIGRVLVLTQILVLLGILGALLSISRAAGRTQVSVWRFFAALSCAVLGDVIFTASGGGQNSYASLAGLLYMLGYLLMGAAALHRTISTFAQPQAEGDGRVSKLRLGLFGGALVVVPLVGGIPQLFGKPPDGLLLTLGPLIMVPLVLFRTRQLLTQRAQDQRDLMYHANHDDLTGLVNRRRVFAAVAQAMRGATREHRPPATVLYCDLDDFKPINDRFGHEAGDEVLRCAARRITAVLRPYDIVARIGGDEFLAYCPDADEATASVLRQRVEDALHAPIDWNGTTLRVGTTVGIAVSIAGRYSSPDELIAAADAAMYERKRDRKAACQIRPAREKFATPAPTAVSMPG